eukprot:COSAG01_NODE_17100_length_1178_cov_3.651529_2_plen_72_part_01
MKSSKDPTPGSQTSDSAAAILLLWRAASAAAATAAAAAAATLTNGVCVIGFIDQLFAGDVRRQRWLPGRSAR